MVGRVGQVDPGPTCIGLPGVLGTAGSLWSAWPAWMGRLGDIPLTSCLILAAFRLVALSTWSRPLLDLGPSGRVPGPPGRVEVGTSPLGLQVAAGSSREVPTAPLLSLLSLDSLYATLLEMGGGRVDPGRPWSACMVPGEHGGLSG